MKRKGNLLPAIAAMENLELAYYKAARGKHGKKEVQVYTAFLWDNLKQLQSELESGRVSVGNYHFFDIYDPKKRTICAAPFGQRVLHHALMNVCHELFEGQQMDESYATRRHKGTYAALDKARTHQRKYRWFLKMDIRKFFDSIDHSTLLELLSRKIKDQPLLHIFRQLLQSYETSPGKGLPIGNLTSQYFANYYLVFADRYLKQQHRVPTMVRYMDDICVWSDEKPQLLEARQDFTLFLHDRLQLQLKISFINRTEQGLSFLGYRLFPHVVRLNKRSKDRFKSRWEQYHALLSRGSWTQEDYQRHILPLLAFARYADTKYLRAHLLIVNC